MISPRAVAPWLTRWLRDNLASRRSRLLLIGLGFTLGLSGLTVLDSMHAEMLQSLSARRLQLGRLQNLGDAGVWQQRRSESERWRASAESRLWEGETDGLAQANLQSWIVEAAHRAGLAQLDIRTSINASATNPLKLRQLTAQISGRFEPDGLFLFLRAIAADERLLLVDRLEVQTVPAVRFEMLLGTFLRPAASS